MQPEKKGQPALGRGDKVLAKLTPVGGGAYEGRTIRRLEAGHQSAVLGVFDVIDGQRPYPPYGPRQRGYDLVVETGETGGAQPGDLVRAEVVARQVVMGLRKARVIEKP